MAAPERELDFVTLVSVIPFPIRENKVGLNPSIYELAAADNPNDPQCLVLAEANYPVYMGDGRTLDQKVGAEELAKSLIKDYCNAQPLISAERRPALFYVVGRKTSAEIRIKYSAQVNEVLQLQRNWFTELVKQADDDWAQYRRHAMISDYQRRACKFMGWQRDWLVDTPQDNPKPCPFCTKSLPPNAIICLGCNQVVDPVAFETKKKELTSKAS